MRPPTRDDILLVLSCLDRLKVDYVLLGGAAMAIHGFPRMTRDVDLLFPLDATNNAKLMTAIEEIGTHIPLQHVPKNEWLDKGFSTAAEGDIGIDILFVAASRTYEEYAPYIEERMLGDVRIRVLNIDGMLLSKQTGREEDIPDRLRLERLKL